MNPHGPVFKLAFGVLGNIIGVGVNLAPMTTFYNIYRTKCTQGFSPMPYVFSLVAALIWVVYGLPDVTPNAVLIITVNSASSLIQIFYLTVFLIYAPKKPKRQLMMFLAGCIAAVTLLAVITLVVIHKPPRRALTVGCFCVVIGVLTYASPLSVAGMVVRTKSAEFLPIVLCVFLFINSTVWTCYGVITNDKFVLIPNGFGVVFGVAQLSLYTIYKKGIPTKSYDKKSIDLTDGKSMKVDEKSVRGPKPMMNDAKLGNGDVNYGNGDAKHENGDAKLVNGDHEKSVNGDESLQPQFVPSQGARNGYIQPPPFLSKQPPDVAVTVMDDAPI